MRPLIATLLLSGCSNVVLSTAAQLSNTNPLTADPADYEIAIDRPEGVDVTEGSATIRFTSARRDTGESFDETFILQRHADTFRINPDDYEAIRALQSRATTWETEAPFANSGSFGIIASFCERGDGPPLDATTSIAIRTEPGGPFLPLVRDTLLTDFADIETLEALPPCP